jgi:hypothetical protein
VSAYTPNYALWSDGATKERWISMPENGWIDTSDMDHWVLPVGTRVWKEFSLDGVRLETRLIERYGYEPGDYWMGTFVWQDDQSDAAFVERGQEDILGTAHDAPSQRECGACHNGEPGRVLGFSALQLARDGSAAAVEDGARGAGGGAGLSLEELAAQDRLSALPAEGARYVPPGDETTSAALGYLHANCGHCHNPFAAAWRETRMLLRLEVDDTDVEGTGVFQSIVGQPLDHFRSQDVSARVEPGRPESSAILARMEARMSVRQMPPLATEEVDDAGIQRITRWVAELPSR